MLFFTARGQCQLNAMRLRPGRRRPDFRRRTPFVDVRPLVNHSDTGRQAESRCMPGLVNPSGFDVFSELPSGVLLLDLDLQVLAWNQRAAELLGVQSVRHNSLQLGFPMADLSQRLKQFVQSSVAGESVADAVQMTSYLRRPDNSLTPVNIVARRTQQSQCRYLVVQFDDGSQQESQRRQLEAEHAIHAAVIDNNVNAIILIDDQDRVQEFNIAACQMFGYLKEEVIQQRLSDLIIPPEARSFHLAGLEKYQKSGGGAFLNRRVEVVAQRKDGERFPVELTLFPLHLNGRTYFSAALQDISERKAAVDALQQARDAAVRANTYKSQFVASMSHEIRTPLNAVLGLLGLLQDSELDDDQHHYVDTAINSGQSLLAILNDVLDLSKIEAGKIELEPGEFSLNELCYGVVELLMNRATEKSVMLACYVDPGIPGTLIGDYGRLRQVLMNLVGNAIKFTESGSVVLRIDKVSLDDHEATLKFTVEDTGIGIAKEDQQKLFDEFVQAEDQDNRRFGGTGLGLSISRKLIALMDSDIYVRSRPGRGSTFGFNLTLDCAVFDDNDEPGVEKTVQHPLQGKELAVWMANDMPALLLKEQLLSLGAVIHSFASLQEYHELIAEEVVDLVVLEQRVLPESPEATLNQLRQRAPLAPAVLLTAGNNRSRARYYAEAGFNSVVNSNTPIQPLGQTLLRALTGVDHSTFDARKHPRTRPTPDIPFRILLAEDSQANQLVATNILRKAGFTIDAVANGMEALEAVQTLPYDLVLMDLQMPEMDGLEATRSIRQLKSECCDIPIVAMTANVIADVKRDCEDAGMQGFVSKPIVREELFAELSRWTDAKQIGLALNEREAPPASAVNDRTAADVVADVAPVAGMSAAAVSDADTAATEGLDTESLDIRVLERLIEDTSKATVARMLTIFLSEADKRMTLIRQALAQADTLQLASEAHTLKSSAASFGARLLADLAKQLEASAKAGIADEPLVKRLNEVGERSIAQLKQWLRVVGAPSESAS